MSSRDYPPNLQAAFFFWCRVFTSLTPLVFGAGSCTYDLLVLTRRRFIAQPAALQPRCSASSVRAATARGATLRHQPCLPALRSQVMTPGIFRDSDSVTAKEKLIKKQGFNLF